MELRSNPVPTVLFIFQLKNILWSNLKSSTSYGRQTNLKSIFGLLLVSFIWLGEQISLKYLLISGVDVCPSHALTVSTSLMPKLVKNSSRILILLNILQTVKLTSLSSFVYWKSTNSDMGTNVPPGLFPMSEFWQFCLWPVKMIYLDRIFMAYFFSSYDGPLVF